MSGGMSNAFMQELEETYGGTFTKYADMTVDDVLRERAAHQILLKQTLRTGAEKRVISVVVQEIPREGPVWPPHRCWVNGVPYRLAGADEPVDLWWHDLLQADHAPVGMVPDGGQ